MAIKIFLAVIAVLALLATIGANMKENKRLAVAVAIAALVLLAAVSLGGKGEDKQTTAIAPDTGEITVDQDQWGTITVTDDTGVTREYQGSIHISGTYPYETYEYMGICVSMEKAIKIGEWKPGLYKMYHEKEELEKEKITNE